MSQPPRRLLLLVACLTTIVVLAVVVANGLGRGSGQAEASSEADPPAAGAAAPAALATPVLSARRVPELVRAHIADERLRAAVAPVLATAPADSCLLVSSGGRPVVAVRSDRPMVPASTQKLLVAAAVLETFGGDHRLQTTASAAAAPEGGVVAGDLYLVGGGDPLLTTPGYQLTFENPAQLSSDYGQLADRLVAAGVREVRGGVVGDESRYDALRSVPTWPARYQMEGHVGPLGALMVNDGSDGFTTDPDQGERVRYPGEPAVLAAETLITLLERRGVQVVGGASAGRAPEGAVEVAALPSRPVSELVSELIADSDNTTAELLVKELGRERFGSGTTVDGLNAVQEILHAAGLPTSGLATVDGSGLDLGNRLTCDLLVAALDQAGAGSVVGTSLAVAGETGTLRRRMRDTPAQGRVHGKTGTLNTVNALAGFADTVGGGQLTFAYLINGPDQSLGYGPLDELAVALVGVDDGPPVDQLSPKPAGP
jgi:D-alanyl-D-alanine carboxypeptidase/D-alanyl-D-alanine-endopeptidase (penicillin-binding protein 4)